jgi:hypothetical protein
MSVTTKYRRCIADYGRLLRFSLQLLRHVISLNILLSSITQPAGRRVNPRFPEREAFILAILMLKTRYFAHNSITERI